MNFSYSAVIFVFLNNTSVNSKKILSTCFGIMANANIEDFLGFFYMYLVSN